MSQDMAQADVAHRHVTTPTQEGDASEPPLNGALAVEGQSGWLPRGTETGVITADTSADPHTDFEIGVYNQVERKTAKSMLLQSLMFIVFGYLIMSGAIVACGGCALAYIVVKATQRLKNKVETFVEWRQREANNTRRVVALRFTNNGIQQAAFNLTPKSEHRNLSNFSARDRPVVAMQNCLHRHGYPSEGHEGLCLRMTMGRTMPAAAGVRDCDEELIKELEKSGEYAKFKYLATRIALKESSKHGSEIWREYTTTDHYAAYYRDWWGCVIHRRQRHPASIDPYDPMVPAEAREVMFTMLFIASSIAPDRCSRFKAEQAHSKIVLDLLQNLQCQVSQAGAYVAAGWAADIVCALLDRPGF